VSVSEWRYSLLCVHDNLLRKRNRIRPTHFCSRLIWLQPPPPSPPMSLWRWAEIPATQREEKLKNKKITQLNRQRDSYIERYKLKERDVIQKRREKEKLAKREMRMSTD
jgi:hypothetical protein